MSRKLIHTRTIVVEVYDEGDDTTSIEGKLEDVQPLDSGYFKSSLRKGDPRPPGVLHGMSTSMKVNRETGEILKTGGDFPGRPYEGCAAVIGWLSKLEGLKITAGYTEKSKEQLGGPKGCAHMNTLLQTMANTRAASSAYFIRPDLAKQMKDVQRKLADANAHPAMNSCHMWREGGPLLTAIAEGKNPVELDI